MNDAFDPYHKWLGIPPKQQPPDHYRLLGINRFECDLDVIDTAANKQMSYLQGCATGKYMALSQKLLNEVAAARVCLLNAVRKSRYDDALRSALARQQPRPIPRASASSRVEASAIPEVAPEVEPMQLRLSKKRTRRRTQGRLVPVPIQFLFGFLAAFPLANFIFGYIKPESDLLGMRALWHSLATIDHPSPAGKEIVRVSAPAQEKLQPVELAPRILEQEEEPIRLDHATPDEIASLTQSYTHTPVRHVPNAGIPAIPTQQSVESQRSMFVSMGRVTEAVEATGELAMLQGLDPLESQIKFIARWNPDVASTRRAVAGEFVRLMELVVAQRRIDLKDRYLDSLLVLVRDVNEPDLLRRATLVAVGQPSTRRNG